MTPQAQERIRDAAARFAGELIEALASEQDTPDRLFDIEATADLLSISRAKVYQEIGAGRLRSLKIGDRRLCSNTSIREYIATAERTGP